MNKLLLVPIILAFGCYAQTQKLKQAEIPLVVKNKFTSLYPNVKNVKWEKEQGRYEAEFEQNNTETSVLFDENGTYVQIEIEIRVSLLPKGIGDYVARNIEGKRIKEAVRITNAQGTVTYEVEVGSDDYLFDANGNFIRLESDDEDSDDDED